MRAMALTRRCSGHVEPTELKIPVTASDQILVRVLACGVCRTDLHVFDGDLQDPTIPVIQVMRLWAASSRSALESRDSRPVIASAFHGWDHMWRV